VNINSKKEILMKRILLLLLVVALVVPVMTIAGTEKEKPAAMEKTQQMEAAPDSDAPDPWILSKHQVVEPYKGEIAFKGPEGQTPTWATDLMLTKAEVEKVRMGQYKIVIPWWALEGEYVMGMRKGMMDAADYLGMKIVAETNTNFDPAQLKTDVETMMALDPDIFIVLPTDTVSAAESLRPVVDAGKVLVLISNLPQGYVHGRDYVGITTSMPYDAATKQVRVLADQVGRDAKVALVNHAANFWITNFQDKTVKETILKEYPDMKIVAEEGFIDPADTTEIVAGILQRHPDVEGFYISFQTACIGALAALQEAGRSDVRVVTTGVMLPLLIDLMKGGNMAGIVNDTTYNIGINCVLLAAYGVLGKPAPEYSLSPNVIYERGMTSEEILNLWDVTYRLPIPRPMAEVLAGM
jgi:ribose transport system substrate-binding protein